MATTRRNGTTQRGTSGRLGLMANGSCGPWEVAIDEATSGRDRWYAQIEGPSITFSFEIPSLSTVRKMILFFETSHISDSRDRELGLAKSKKLPITLLKDDEYADRFFLLVGLLSAPTVRFVLTGEDVAKLATALRQVEEQLDD